MRALVLISLLAGCGRMAFDPDQRDAGVTSDVSTDALRSTTRTAPTFIDQASISASNNTDHLSAVLPGTVQAGRFIVVAVGFDTGDATTTFLQAVTDQANDAFTIIPSVEHGQGGDGNQQWLAYGFAQHTGPIQVTATLSKPFAIYMDLRVHEFAGVDPDDPLDGIADPTSGEIGTDPVLTTLTHTANSVVFGFTITDEGVTEPGIGFTMLTQSSMDVTQMGIAADPGAYTMTAKSTGKWTFNTIAFRGAPE